MPDDDPFDDIFDAVDRLVDDLFGIGPTREERPIVDANGVNVDVYEQDDTVEVVADLQGSKGRDLELVCDGRVLRIRADEQDVTVDLPATVDETSAETTFNHGVLSVTFDRAEGDGATLDLS